MYILCSTVDYYTHLDSIVSVADLDMSKKLDLIMQSVGCG